MDLLDKDVKLHAGEPRLKVSALNGARTFVQFHDITQVTETEIKILIFLIEMEHQH